MEITEALRKYAVENLNVAADAADDDIRKAVSDAITKGDLDLDTLKKLMTTKAAGAEARIAAMVDEQVKKAFDANLGPLNEKLDALGSLLKPAEGDDKADDPPADTKADDTPADDTPPLATKNGAPNPADTMTKAGTAGIDGAGAADGYNIRVKSVVEQFDDTRTAATWAKSSKEHLRNTMGDQQLKTATEGPGARPINMPTERSQAITGAWFRKMVAAAFRRSGRPVPHSYRMRDIDKKLCDYAVHECKFVGPLDWNDSLDDARQWLDPYGQKLSDIQRKALLDDATTTGSGGLEAVPIEFDDAAVLTPLLHGELYPYVSIRNATRRRIEGFSVGNPTLSWGVAEGSQISLFDTDDLIAALDTTIFPLTGAIEIGLDFEADSPVGVGNILVNNYGQRFQAEMDNVIATGSGTARPTGLLNTSGVSAITPEGTAGAAQTVGDYEALLFGVAKQYRAEARRAGGRTCFIGTETSYQRARSIDVSETDARRVFGMETNTHEDYAILGHRYAINESLSNAEILFCCLNRYRLYRRQGLEVRVVTEDKELARKNQQMILVRARFGGQNELSGSMSKITAGQA